MAFADIPDSAVGALGLPTRTLLRLFRDNAADTRTKFISDTDAYSLPVSNVPVLGHASTGKHLKLGFQQFKNYGYNFSAFFATPSITVAGNKVSYSTVLHGAQNSFYLPMFGRVSVQWSWAPTELVLVSDPGLTVTDPNSGALFTRQGAVYGDGRRYRYEVFGLTTLTNTPARYYLMDSDVRHFQDA